MEVFINITHDSIEKRLEYLKKLVNNDEEFDIILEQIEYKVKKKYKWKLFFNTEDIYESIGLCVGEEILKRSNN